MATKKRSLTKSVTWRIISVIVLSMVSFSVDKDVKAALYITIVYTLVQVFLYFVHERIWNKITWGR
jgi:uncharacterized membrane protein